MPDALGQVVGHSLRGGREDRADHDADLVALHQLPGLVDGDDRVGAVVGLDVLERAACSLVVEHGESGQDALLGQRHVVGHEAGEALVEADLDGLAGGGGRRGVGAARRGRSGAAGRGGGVAAPAACRDANANTISTIATQA